MGRTVTHYCLNIISVGRGNRLGKNQNRKDLGCHVKDVGIDFMATGI